MHVKICMHTCFFVHLLHFEIFHPISILLLSISLFLSNGCYHYYVLLLRQRIGFAWFDLALLYLALQCLLHFMLPLLAEVVCVCVCNDDERVSKTRVRPYAHFIFI